MLSPLHSDYTTLHTSSVPVCYVYPLSLLHSVDFLSIFPHIPFLSYSLILCFLLCPLSMYFLEHLMAPYPSYHKLAEKVIHPLFYFPLHAMPTLYTLTFYPNLSGYHPSLRGITYVSQFAHFFRQYYFLQDVRELNSSSLSPTFYIFLYSNQTQTHWHYRFV